MKAEELRKGNLHQYETATGVEIGVIEGHDICELESDPLDDFYKPIPLTEDWLKKFGFHRIDLTENGNGRAPFWRNKDKMILEEYHGESAFRVPLEGCKFTWNEYHKIIPIYFVHELQNLFFVIVGEELTLKK